eukprot:Platyproteum_vivax@DN759_c0_g1_i1.p1
MCHIYTPERGGKAMVGAEFNRLVGGLEKNAEGQDVVGNPSSFAEVEQHLQVLARSQPADKYTLVVGLRNMGHVVAVTGDGTNDAPALKKADVGFAMGLTGKEVAKAAADIVLLDDNFDSIVKAVRWGRNIFDNIRRFLQFQLTVNVVAVTTAFVSAVVIRDTPLTSIQLLWVNLIMDTLGAIALATEPPTDALLDRLPHSRHEYLVSKEMWKNILGQSIYQLGWMFSLIFAGERFLPEFGEQELFSCPVGQVTCPQADYSRFSKYGNGHQYVRSGRRWLPFSNQEDYKEEWTRTVGPSRHFTYVFNIFVFFQLFNMINCRKLQPNEKNVFKGVFNSKGFMIIWAFVTVLQVALIYIGGIALNCHLDGLTWQQWGVCLPIAMGGLLVRFLLCFLPSNWLPETGKKEINPMEAPVTFSERLRGRSAEGMRMKITSHSSVSFIAK